MAITGELCPPLQVQVDALTPCRYKDPLCSKVGVRWYLCRYNSLGSREVHLGFPGGSVGKEPACKCKRCGFDPWVRKIPLEEGLATHCSLPAWSIPWTEEPGGLQSLVLQRVRHA